MGFLSFTLQLIDFLAWPLIALGYPICASIRAIETGSKYHMRKLVTYWTIFSFISLFEHLFEKLTERVPLWPYIKLITICWLVIPEFNGACCSYQLLVHPCLPLKLHNVIAQFYGSCYVCQRFAYFFSFVNLQTFTDWFNKPMEDPSLKNETFLSVAERYLEENGSDPLVKLIASKVEGVKENQIQIEKKTVGMQVEEMIVPADVEEIKLPEITSVKQVQTEWTCAVCQVTTTSEHNLKSHLNGRKHKAKCEELKTCKQVAKSEGISPVTTKSNQLNQVQVKHAAAAQSDRSANEAADPKQIKSVKETLVQVGKKTTGVPIKETTLPADQGIIAIYQGRDVESVKENQIQIEKKMVGMQVEETIVPADVEEIKLPEITSIKQVQTEWTCAVCQVTTTSEHSLKSHLNGRKHKVKCEELKTCKQTAKIEGDLPVSTKKSNELEQEQVNHAAAPQSEHSTNEAADPKQVKSVKENLVQVGKKTTGVPIKETTLPADNTKEIKLRETNSLKNVQKEWTCAVCQVTTKSEHDLKCHLVGRKHREKCEELKTCKKKTKTERNPPDQLKEEQVKHARSAQTSEGFGFIRYSTHTEAARAIQLGNAPFLFGKPIKCSWGSKPTPPGTTSTPLPPPAMAHVPGFSATDLAAYEWQLALARMGGSQALMHSQDLMHSQGQAIYDGGYANIATIQPPMYY